VTGEQLAEALAAVIEAPERYASMREAAKNLAGQQSWDRTANEFLSLLASR
jgi:UDP-N-acetylglucosamine:LPS N-acetylglucosamine transferase